MQPFSSLFISIMSLFGAGVATEVNDFFVVSDLRLVGLGFKPFLIAYSFVSVFIAVNAIGEVLPMIRNSKIAKPIVRFVPINMINRLKWLFSCDIKPCKPMGGAMFPVNLKVNIPLVMQAPSNLTNSDFGPWLCPNENPCFGIVGKYIRKVFMIDMLHDPKVTYSTRTEKD